MFCSARPIPLDGHQNSMQNGGHKMPVAQMATQIATSVILFASVNLAMLHEFGNEVLKALLRDQAPSGGSFLGKLTIFEIRSPPLLPGSLQGVQIHEHVPSLKLKTLHCDQAPFGGVKIIKKQTVLK